MYWLGLGGPDWEHEGGVSKVVCFIDERPHLWHSTEQGSHNMSDTSLTIMPVAYNATQETITNEWTEIGLSGVTRTGAFA